MAPKKTLLVLSILFFTGIAAAQPTIEDVPQQVWLNSDDPEFDFNVNFSENCSSNVVEVRKGESVLKSYTNSTGALTFAGFEGAGTYNVNASCTSDSSSNSKSFDAGNLGLSLDSIQIGDGSENVVYPGEEISGQLSVSVPENMDEPENLTYSSSIGSIESKDFSLTVDETDMDTQELVIGISNFDASVSREVSILPVWQFTDLSVAADESEVESFVPSEGRATIKYRNLADLKLSFTVLKRGEAQTGLKDHFRYGEGAEVLSVDRNGGSYTLTFDSTPVYDLDPTESEEVEISLDASDSEEEVGILNLTIENDVKFSGNVLDVSNNPVSTQFQAVIDDGGDTKLAKSFYTGDGSYFEQYFEEGSVDMEMRFDKNGPRDSAQATVSLSSMEIKKKDAGDINYQYYNNPEKESSIDPDVGIRSVNLAAFVSNYPFTADSLDTFARMSYDTSSVDPLEVQVYECSQWTFDAEKCSSNWQKIDTNDVELSSGSTWKAEFPIDPLTSNRFRDDDKGFLQNAYLVGVPKGVGSSLTLQNSLDVSSARLKSGEELTVSGKVISEETGEAVSGADLELSLVSDGNSVDLDGESGSDGSFEFSTQVEEAGDYSVEFSAEKNPYESFRKESDSSINVYYQTGLTVSTENEVEISTGEVSTIDFTVENTGQSEISDMELSVSGIDDQYYSLTPASLSSVDSGDSRTVEMRLDLPGDYCNGPCDPPAITVDVSGSSAGDQLQNSASVYTSFPADDENTQESESSDNSSSENDSQSSMGVPGPEEVSRMTGNFVQSQSDMNLALGLILIFGMILAVTVRKRKDGDGDRENRMRGSGVSASAAGSSGSSRVQRPDVSSSDKKDEDPDNEGESEEDEEVQSEDDDSSESEEELVCDTCGEEFDTESGLKLHKDAFH